MSKVFNLKQEKKYRNQTINVLTHLNSRTTINKLDKSIKSFKAHKQQVQSSRVQNTSMYKKDTHSIQSQSRNGDKSYKSTKKNSLPKYSKVLQQSIEKRLKKIHNIFNNQISDSKTPQSLEIYLSQIGQKFKNYRNFVQVQKQQMLFDDLDYIMSNIIKGFENKIAKVLEISSSEQINKIQQFQILTQKVISYYQTQILKQKEKAQHLQNTYLQHIQNLTVKSLYTTQKINYINYLGLIDFQKHCRNVDENYTDDITLSIHNSCKQINKNSNDNMKAYQLNQPPFQYTQSDIENIDQKMDIFRKLDNEDNFRNKNGVIRKQNTQQNYNHSVINPNLYQRVNMGGGQFKIVLKDYQ